MNKIRTFCEIQEMNSHSFTKIMCKMIDDMGDELDALIIVLHGANVYGSSLQHSFHKFSHANKDSELYKCCKILLER